MRRVLMTGAGGFVGRHALPYLAGTLPPGDRIAGIGRGAAGNLPERAEHRRIDLLDRHALHAFLAAFRPTHTLHLAGLSSVHGAAAAPARAWRANVEALLNLAEGVAAHAPGSTFLFVSSGEVYGRAFLDGTAVTEDVEPRPSGTYAHTKLAGERLVGDVLPPAGVKPVVLRPFNHAGPGQDARFVIASFAAQIARIEAGLAEPVLEVGDLSARRDFLDVADVVSAYAAVIEGAQRLPDGTILNVASGHARSIGAIADDLRALSHVPFDIRVAPDRLRPAQVPVACGSSAALARATGWQPRIAWTETLSRILDDARARLARQT